MPFQFSTASVNAALDALETAIGVGAVLKIRTGAAPATVATADSGIVLATLNLPSDWMAAASARSKAKLGTWEDLLADAAGTAGHFRIYQSDGTTAHIQGPIVQNTTAADGEMALVNVTITAGQPVTVTAFTLTGPAA